jgi:tyrosine-protein phosphatase 2/3
MVLATSRRPSSTLPHSHSQRSKTSSTPSNHPSRAAASVGYSMPPSSSLRSPATQDNVRTPSPNYFSLTVDSQSDPRESGVGPKDNWSPPTSSIRSFNPQSPKHVPLDANPEFEAFRRQTDANNAFSLGHGNLSHFSSTPGPSSARSRSDRTTSRSDLPAEASSPRTLTDGQSEASSAIPSFFDLPRQESPANIGAGIPPPPVRRSILSHLDDRHPRLSLPSNRADPPSPYPAQLDMHHRADTLPSTLEDGPVMISSSELKALLENSSASQLLVLDLRVAPQFSQKRINGALNLCIPTTLLKRPSFNLVKLTDTFKVEEEKARFSTWRVCKNIVVYDARSTEKRDATSAINTLKKFTNEGWDGRPFILRGGIEEFSRKYPHLIDDRSGQEIPALKKNLSLSSLTADVAPIAGGCEIPGSKSVANPFFSNIRQNMDLVGGVGQVDVKRPDDIDPLGDNFLPSWLRKAAAVEDHGKTVAAKFLHIEQDELSRMQQALSSRVSYGTPVANPESYIQIAGFEKGGKNRYNNIWPFEHARVRLQGRPEGACDYVNASHIKASWSNKRYIASQGPLPATFEVSWHIFGLLDLL